MSKISLERENWWGRRNGLRLVAALASILLFALPSASGQQTNEAAYAARFAGPQTADALNVLPKSSQLVIERLSSLSEIPVPKWRIHVGDIAHGESTELDDSSWPMIQVPYKSTTTEAVWIRAWIEIPRRLHGYDLIGTRIQMKSWRDKKVTVFSNGLRIADGEDLEPTVLFDSVKPGDKALVAVRIGTDDDDRDIQSVPGLSLEIGMNSHRPSPEDMHAEFVMAALLIPHLAKDGLSAYATLNKSIADVDLQALDANDQDKFDSSLRRSQQDLEAIRPILQCATLHLTGNSHIDAAWLWPWTETVDVVRRTFGTALQLMDEYPEFTYTQSAAQYNEWMAEKYPAINEEINKRIKEGRWEIVGGMWVEPDLNMPNGESQVRQLLIGQRSFERLYGVTTRIGWNPDSFGYDWQLPQIYKKSGIDYFVTQKLSANETNPLPFKLFWWESPDGSKVLTYFPHSYGNQNLDPLRLSNDLFRAQKLAPGMMEMMDLYGIGDHGGGATRAILDQGTHWTQADKIAPRFEFGTAQSYFSSVEKKIASESPVWNYQAMAKGAGSLPTPPMGEISIPTWKDELYFEHHRGTYTTQAKHKKNMRTSEVRMLNAETYSSLAWLNGEPYPAVTLNDAWKKVLFNEFHDLAAGSGIGQIYVDAQRDYDQVRWATDEASANALQNIQSRIDTQRAGDVPVLVVNPLGWRRSGLVQVDVQMPIATDEVSILDAENRVLPAQTLSRDSKTNTFHLLAQASDVPSAGYQVLHVVTGKRPFASDLKAGGTTIENNILRVILDPGTGCITSILRKKDNYEVLAPGACGNQIQLFRDTPTGDDAWNIDPGTLDHFTPLMRADSVKLVENGPLRSVLHVSRTWQNSKIDQDIVLYAGADQVEVINDIDWHETHILMKTAFPLAASSSMATYEIPFGTIDRPTTRDNSWDKAKFEVSALNWADLGNGKNGLSLINDSKYGYDCEGNVLRLTLLRSPVSPDPNADRGHHHFGFVLYPHTGDWKSALSIRRGNEYNNPLRAMQVSSHTGTLPLEHSFISLDENNVVLTAVKKAEDADGIILHAYEWKGQNGKVEIHVPPGAKSATMTNLMEKVEGDPLSIEGSGDISIPIHPFEIISIRIDYPHAQE